MSSPPARGCSSPEPRARQEPRSRPRPRGGAPLWLIGSGPSPPSSPPARGLLPVRRLLLPVRVVPARAGVSAAQVQLGTIDASSPPARGCSADVLAGGLGHVVVPARAGVLLARSSCSMIAASSPPARGCSVTWGNDHACLAVVPARAGVLPGCRVVPSPRRRPRPRGGAPTPPPTTCGRSQSSPPARGCSLTSPAPRPHLAVVPARAGVLRLRRTGRCAAARRPRPRGGAPFLFSATLTTPKSSPPARGCSDLSRWLCRPRTGRPRPRGGAPRRSARPARRTRRPRPRGGAP